MKSVRPGHSEPLAGGDPPPQLATILVRFLALFVVAVAILMIAWRA